MLKEMRYVYAVYRERGFSKAAQSLCVTQPVVSTMVKRAEEEFGAKIFDRSTTPISLTSAGKLYIQAIEEILAIQDEILDLFADTSSRKKYHIRIGAPSMFCTYILPPVIKEFKEKFSYIEVYWKEDHNSGLAEMLQNGELDFVFEEDDFNASVFDAMIWGKELLILAVPAGDPINNTLIQYRYTGEEIRQNRHIGKLRPCVPFDFFSQKPFIFLQDGNDIAMRSAMLCKHAGFRPQIAMKVDQLITAYNLTREGNGTTIIPDQIPQYVDDAGKLFFYMLDSPLIHRTVKLYSRKNHVLSPAAMSFWEYARQSCPAVQ